jgi:hypothetical protein
MERVLNKETDEDAEDPEEILDSREDHMDVKAA